MTTPVVKGAAYVLVHTPDMVMHYGTTCSSEHEANPNSEFLKKVPSHLRTFEEAVKYAPNQAYIGNILPDELNNIPRPWYKNLMEDAKADGKMGEMLSQDELYIVMKLCDAFDLVMLEKSFSDAAKEKISKKPYFTEAEIAKIKDGFDISEIESKLAEGAEPLHYNGKVVGCVKAAHATDKSLTAHIMAENIATKATAVIATKNLLYKNNISPDSIEYVIECSEEACGDMNQRGGGNFAKAIAEVAGLVSATGSDTRGFCAAPTHALINAAAMVKSGLYKSVAVVAGGATAKLGMNGRDHVNKDVPILEDCLGAFAILVTEDDGVNPVLRTDIVGRHTVGTGSSPQAVMESIITKPLDKNGLKITDIDKYSVEMQNPEITEPAGAGDVPLANYKMIAALGAKRGDIDKANMPTFIKEHGMPGFAPTQGHIPSGVPFVGAARSMILDGKINRAMIVGKGSLFLGRMTNLFDGVSIVMEKNPGKAEEMGAVSKEEIKGMVAETMKEFAAFLLNRK
ncbi:glycine/sarcosine/betaine reductase complex component C subunit beta [Lutispora thermophila]|uniref:3-Oxoacyl-[acyl-carrier-protein (ACP)] synthase III n=1 Tax=Lutispora thermophila DSM 19022 TaxID=1122184 RepID=A0A1M6H9S2_9FIRM|nr:glycine/sarcosine/betaine reductase complex component C subunit beta [Lutispora thermophila]SHJ18967.1 3-Oxoacyl-[acyl-carrier-protein (ACP)] synthase III [Lutispora thermophila DSM 19022]